MLARRSFDLFPCFPVFAHFQGAGLQNRVTRDRPRNLLSAQTLYLHLSRRRLHANAGASGAEPTGHGGADDFLNCARKSNDARCRCASLAHDLLCVFVGRLFIRRHDPHGAGQPLRSGEDCNAHLGSWQYSAPILAWMLAAVRAGSLASFMVGDGSTFVRLLCLG
jgi:hypothetical protein